MPSGGDKFTQSVAVAIQDHRDNCKSCRFDWADPKKEYYGKQWIFCSVIQPLVDFWSILS